MWNRAVEISLLAIMKIVRRKREVLHFESSAIDRSKRILLMTTTAIGDTMFSTPAIRAVKETYPEKEVHVLCHIRNSALLRENPYIDRLFFFRGKRKGIFSLCKSLKKQHYDMVIILHGNDPECIPLAWSTNAPCLIGSGTSPFAFLLSRAVTFEDETRHAIEKRLDMVRVIGANTRNKKMDLFLSPKWEEKAEGILQSRFPDSLGPLIGMHPTGTGRYKWWPSEYFCVLADKLLSRYNARFIIFSSCQEATVVRSIGSQLGNRVLLADGRFDLAETASLIRRCNLFIANDSGPMHMALALGVPTLALIGADSPKRIGPYLAEKAAYIYKKEQVCDLLHCLNQRCPDNRCMKIIYPEEVFRIVADQFAEELKGVSKTVPT